MAIDADVRPTDLLTNRSMLRGPQRAADLHAEIAAFCELSTVIAENPRAALHRFPEIAIRLCHAGSAGVSLLHSNRAGSPTIHWEAVSGALASRAGVTSPRDNSPCGLCLDAGATVLLGQPERAFAWLRKTAPLILEDLIVPLIDRAGRELGTLWIAHHDPALRFSSDEARILEQLSTHLVLTLQLLEQSRENSYAQALAASNQLSHSRNLAQDLAAERHLRKQAEASEKKIRQVMEFKEMALHEANHRVKNTLQVAASMLSLHERATKSARVRAALQESARRLHLLAKVHEMLFDGSANTQEILMPTLLETMGNALRQGFGDAQCRVQLQITAEPVLLSPEEAVPLALLTNEVVTNAYKHAFPTGVAGTVAVNLSCGPEGVITMRIMDNGVGMRANGHRGLGLRLIKSLADQLQAALAFEAPAASTGTVVTVRLHRGAQRTATGKLTGDGHRSRRPITPVDSQPGFTA